MMEFVYIAKCESFFKIGKSNNLKRREKGLQTGNPFDVSIIAYVESYEANSLEKSIQNRYRDRKIKGEWFDLDQDDFLNIVNRFGFTILNVPEIPKVPIDLYEHGFGDPFCKINTHRKPILMTNIMEVRDVVKVWRKSKSWHIRYSSYGLKSLVERKIGKYISNGLLIKAMILEGFLYKRGSVNAQFNVNDSDIRKFEKSLKQ